MLEREGEMKSFRDSAGMEWVYCDECSAMRRRTQGDGRQLVLPFFDHKDGCRRER
jgi:hypothetical protein